jgi:predicted secreted Zn-dependent protease
VATHIHPPERVMHDYPGHTLAEVASAISAVVEAGRAEWWPSYSCEWDGDIVSSATVNVTQRMTMPRWPGYTHASDAAKAEWDRFWHALEQHEEGHFHLVQSYLATLDQQLVGQHRDAVQRGFEQALNDLATASENYDAQTNHGLSYGTVLDVSVDAHAVP